MAFVKLKRLLVSSILSFGIEIVDNFDWLDTELKSFY